MAQISIGGGNCYYGAYSFEALGCDIMRRWDDILYAMDPIVLEQAEEERGSLGPFGILEYYLLHSCCDIVI